MMTGNAARQNQAKARAVELIAADLEAVLADTTAAYERLQALSAEHRGAVARADAAGLDRCLREETRAAGELARLESKRRALVGELAGERGGPASGAGGAMNLAQLLMPLAEPAASRVRQAAERLRPLVEAVRREHRVIRAATRALLGHVDGVLQQIARALGDAGTYSRQGRVEAAPVVTGSFDMTR